AVDSRVVGLAIVDGSGGASDDLVARDARLTLRTLRPLRTLWTLRPGRELARLEVLGQQRAVLDLSAGNGVVGQLRRLHGAALELRRTDAVLRQRDRRVAGAAQRHEQRDEGEDHAGRGTAAPDIRGVGGW